jgi:phenylalanyl-tRNA synthetase beta subunit
VDAVWAAQATDARLSALHDFRLFDLYRPAAEGSSKSTESPANALFSKEKSLAFRWLLQDNQRALGDAEADAAMAAIAEAMAAGVGARVRG